MTTSSTWSEPTGETASDVAVAVDNLRKEFGELTAVDGVSFTIRDGEFFTLVGPSGCGKTTLLRMLAGLEDETAGSISIDGSDMTAVPPEKRPTSMVFQDLALFPFRNVFENLTFGLKMQGESRDVRRERAEEMLNVLDLQGYADSEIEELSGGEQQRIALGRSLLTEPDLLLLDEPLSSLDVKLRKEMQLELRRIHEDLESTFFYVTHDQEVALTASDRIGVMNDGRLVQVGTPREVYEEPATPFVAEFIGDTNLFEGVIDGANGTSVETDSGLEIVAADRDDLPDSGKVFVSVRPERIIVSESSVDADNSFEGTVADRIYQGDDITYEVTVGDVRLQAEQPVADNDELLKRGETVSIRFDRESAYVITE